MIYEVRTYSIKTGELNEFERRFSQGAHHTIYYLLGASWHTEIGIPLNKVAHVWLYDNLEAPPQDLRGSCYGPGSAA